VLAIDADPQASLTISFGYNPDELEAKEKTLYFSLLHDTPLSALAVGDNPKLIPSSIQLADAEPELITNILLSAATVLKDKIKEIRDQYDFILIDCPPTLGLLTISKRTYAKEFLLCRQISPAVYVCDQCIHEERCSGPNQLRHIGKKESVLNQLY